VRIALFFEGLKFDGNGLRLLLFLVSSKMAVMENWNFFVVLAEATHSFQSGSSI